MKLLVWFHTVTPETQFYLHIKHLVALNGFWLAMLCFHLCWTELVSWTWCSANVLLLISSAVGFWQADVCCKMSHIPEKDFLFQQQQLRQALCELKIRDYTYAFLYIQITYFLYSSHCGEIWKYLTFPTKFHAFFFFVIRQKKITMEGKTSNWKAEGKASWLVILQCQQIRNSYEIL